MAHVRTQIRKAFKDAFDKELPSGYDVYSSRKSAINHKPGRALVDMRFLNDQTRTEETMSDDRIHVPSLYIRIQRSAQEGEIDDLLDQDEVNVINAIAATEWGDLLEEPPEVMQSNFTDDATGGYILGGIVLRFDLEYRIDLNKPEKTIS